MLSMTDRLDLYKKEKADLSDMMDENEFPPFTQWNAEYVKDYQTNHRTVSVDQADKEMDAIVADVEAAEECLADLVVDKTTEEADSEQVDSIDEQTTNTKETIMSTPETTEATTVTSIVAPTRKKRVVAKANEPKSKMAQARSIYKSLTRGKNVDRSKILARFISDVKLSEKGAATYYQTLKSEKKAA